MAKQPRLQLVSRTEVGAIFDVSTNDVPDLMAKHGIPVVASTPQGRGVTLFYDADLVYSLKDRLDAAIAEAEAVEAAGGTDAYNSLHIMQTLSALADNVADLNERLDILLAKLDSPPPSDTPITKPIPVHLLPRANGSVLQ